MLEQYSPPQMAGLFDDRARMSRWLEIELAALEAQQRLGHAPAGSVAAARDRVPGVDAELIDAVHARRRVTGHELAAFVDVVAERLGPEAEWFHFGLTAADVIDTGNGLMLARACDMLAARLDALYASVVVLAREHAATSMMGRTHGMYAEPTTFGAKVATWGLRLARDQQRLASARENVAVGEMSGPVGTYANVDPRLEAMVCDSLGLGRSVNGQSISRDRYAQYVWACANVATTIEAIATQLRLLHTSEVGEVHEAFADGRKGSSSMPHKKNPIASMELCGLARVVRGYLVTSMESTVIWHEGDTTHLAVERIVLPDVSNLVCWQLEQARALIESIEVDSRAMAEKFDHARGLPFSSSLMHVLIGAGLDRDAAYRAVQQAAALARDQDLGLEEAFARAHGQAYDAGPAFSLDHALRNAHLVVDALDVEGRP